MIHGNEAELSKNFFFDKIAKSIRCLVFMNSKAIDVKKNISLKIIGEIDFFFRCKSKTQGNTFNHSRC